jgi:preprotein translocase subunit YajC
MDFLQFAIGATFAEGEQPQPMAWLWILMIGIFVLYYFVVIRGNRREKSSREDMLSSLKKNDRVVTIGGIIGTVASTSQDGKEVTLKIDDNARMKVLRTAIQGPLREQDQKPDADKSAKDRIPEEASK